MIYTQISQRCNGKYAMICDAIEVMSHIFDKKITKSSFINIFFIELIVLNPLSDLDEFIRFSTNIQRNNMNKSNCRKPGDFYIDLRSLA